MSAGPVVQEARDDNSEQFRPGGWTPRLVVILILLILPSELGFLVFAYPSNAVTQIAGHFHTNQVAWLQTAYALTASVTAAITGKLADRIGKRRVLVGVMGVVLIGLIISSLAPNFGLLIAGRVLQGPALSIPFLLPSLIRDVFPTKAVPLSVSLSTTGAGIISILTTLCVGVVIQHFGFRATFWIPAIIAAVLMVVVTLFVPETPIRVRQRLDVVGTILLGLGVAGTLFAVSLGPTWGWASFKTLGCLVGGVVLLVVWTIQALRSREPLVDLRRLSHFPLVVTLVIAAITVGCTTWFYVLMPIVAQTPTSASWGLGLSTGGEAIIATIYSIGTFASGFATGRALVKLSAPLVAVAILVVSAIAFVLAAVGLHHVVLFALASLLLGGVVGAGYAVSFNLVILVVPREEQATMSAVVALAANMFSAILPVVLFAVMNGLNEGNAGSSAPAYTLGGMWIATLVPAGLGVVGALFAAALMSSQRRAGTALQAGLRS